MILSSLITPVRIYNEFHELDKFTKNYSKFDRFELITDKTGLLPFQFMRDKSPYPIFKMWLRQECNNFYNELLNKTTSNFIDPSAWSVSAGGAIISGGLAQFTVGSGVISKNITTVGNKYRLKVIVDSFLNDNGMTLEIKNGASFVMNIASVGTHIIDITATANSLSLNSIITGSDYAHISEFSVYEIKDMNTVTGDYELDPTILEVKSTTDKNIITYCGTTFSNTLPCGKYYIVMQSKNKANNDEYYFSEVITIKNFIRTQSPYPIMKWLNSCDLENVKYTGLDCNYYNWLYFDGAISRAEYPFDEEVQKNGQGVETPVFQKWEKSQHIFIPKASEFIVDALTAMKLHDTVKFIFPLKETQQIIDFTNDLNAVESLSFEIDHILNDSATNVSLKVLLADRIIDTTCCTDIVLDTGCIMCTYQLEGICVDSENVKLCPKDGGLPGYDYFVWNGSSWVLTTPTAGILLCFTDETPSLYYNGSSWVHVPSLSTFTNATNTITVTGQIFLSTVCQIILTRGTFVYTVPAAYSAAQIAAGVTLNKADLPAILFSGGDLDVSIHNIDGPCDYGYSNTMTLCYGEGC
jgi:hypothetical protein